MPRLLCFMPAPQQNTPPHNKTPALQRPQPTDARRHDVPTNQKRRRPPAQTRQPVYVEVTAQKEVATTTVVSAMALYAYLRHALSGCHETPRPSLPLLSRGLPVNVCLRHTPLHHAYWVVMVQAIYFTMQNSSSTSDIYTRYKLTHIFTKQ